MPETCERPRRLHPLTRLETHWGHFSPGLHNIAWQGDGYLVDPIALCGAFMNVAFEWRWASRHPDSLYFTVCGKWPWCDFKGHKDVIMPPLSPPQASLLLSHKEGVSSDLLFSLYVTHGMAWFKFLFLLWLVALSERDRNWIKSLLVMPFILLSKNLVKNTGHLKDVVYRAFDWEFAFKNVGF